MCSPIQVGAQRVFYAIHRAMTVVGNGQVACEHFEREGRGGSGGTRNKSTGLQVADVVQTQDSVGVVVGEQHGGHTIHVMLWENK